MVDAGGSELGSTPSRTSNSLWTVVRPDPADGRDAAVRPWCNWHDQMASSEEGDDLGIGRRGEVFMVGGSWFERVVCSCLHHVEPCNMSLNFLDLGPTDERQDVLNNCKGRKSG